MTIISSLVLFHAVAKAEGNGHICMGDVTEVNDNVCPRKKPKEYGPLSQPSTTSDMPELEKVEYVTVYVCVYIYE